MDSHLSSYKELYFAILLHSFNLCIPYWFLTSCSMQSASVWGGGGRVEITVSKFMAIQQALQPDWFQCLADGEASCEEGTSIKRARKSVDRSLLFLDNCLRLQEESEVRLPHWPLRFTFFPSHDATFSLSLHTSLTSWSELFALILLWTLRRFFVTLWFYPQAVFP